MVYFRSPQMQDAHQPKIKSPNSINTSRDSVTEPKAPLREVYCQVGPYRPHTTSLNSDSLFLSVKSVPRGDCTIDLIASDFSVSSLLHRIPSLSEVEKWQRIDQWTEEQCQLLVVISSELITDGPHPLVWGDVKSLEDATLYSYSYSSTDSLRYRQTLVYSMPQTLINYIPLQP